MESKTASLMTDRWSNSGGRTIEASGYVRRTLQESLPDPVDAWATVAPRTDAPGTLLVISGDTLFKLNAREHGGQAALEVTMHPLSPDTGKVSRTVRFVQDQDVLHRICGWTFRRNEELLVELQTVQHHGDPFSDGVPPTELFARELARRLGWQFPPHDA